MCIKDISVSKTCSLNDCKEYGYINAAVIVCEFVKCYAYLSLKMGI